MAVAAINAVRLVLGLAELDSINVLPQLSSDKLQFCDLAVVTRESAERKRRLEAV
jgi:hypothetical protein